MPLDALTSAEISLPATPDATQVRERIAVLSRHVDLVGLTDNHAGKPRMSPLAAVALAREQGVATVVHVSCRDRNRLALRSQVIGAAALGSEGILCLYGDAVPDVPRVRDYTTTRLLAEARDWAAPHDLALGCVADPFRPDVEAELALLGRKVAAGADFVQTQMVFDPAGLARLPGAGGRGRQAGRLPGPRQRPGDPHRPHGRHPQPDPALPAPGEGGRPDRRRRRHRPGRGDGHGPGRPRAGPRPPRHVLGLRGAGRPGRRRLPRRQGRPARSAPPAAETARLSGGWRWP